MLAQGLHLLEFFPICNNIFPINDQCRFLPLWYGPNPQTFFDFHYKYLIQSFEVWKKIFFFSSPGRSRFLAILVSGTKTTSNLIFCFSVLLFFWFRLANWLRIKARLWSTNILSAKCQGNNDQFTRYISWNVAMMDAVTYQIYRELSQETLRMTASCSVWYLMITFERYLANNSKNN